MNASNGVPLHPHLPVSMGMKPKHVRDLPVRAAMVLCWLVKERDCCVPSSVIAPDKDGADSYNHHHHPRCHFLEPLLKDKRAHDNENI